ncbi:MAG: AAA family ATPase [Verrucomicrobiota bacterium]
MRIKAIHIANIPPFAEAFMMYLAEPQTTSEAGKKATVDLIVGQNGTGKSRILSCIAYLAGAERAMIRRGMKEPSGGMSLAHVPANSFSGKEPSFRLEMDGPGSLNEHPGFRGDHTNRDAIFFDHTPVFSYSGTAYIDDSAVQKETSGGRNDHLTQASFHKPPEYSQLLIRRLIKLQCAGAQEYRARTLGGPRPAIDLLEWNEYTLAKLEEVLTTHFGQGWPVAFKADVDSPSIEVLWRGSYLGFSMLPDGFKVILGWLVDLSLRLHESAAESAFEREAIVLMDEPECHLHPAWQRKLIPVAQSLFPNVQFIIATHSPFMAMSLNEGRIHKLILGKDGLVKCDSKRAEKGDSILAAIREIFEIEEMFDPETELLFAQFRTAKANAVDGMPGAREEAGKILNQIADRGEELALIARAEALQLRDILKANPRDIQL